MRLRLLVVRKQDLLRGEDREYAGYRRVGIRLSEPLDPALAATAEPRDLDEFAPYLLHFDRAQLVMLVEQGVVGEADGGLMARVLGSIDISHGATERGQRWTVTGGETQLIRSLGMDVGGRIHSGRSSIDLERTAQRMRLRVALLDVMDALNAYRRASVELGALHVATVMPVYLQGHAAQPTTFGHYLQAVACQTERDFNRLDAAYTNVNVSPAGGAASVGTVFPIDRERLAELLGFDGVSANTRDSSYHYDFLWETAAALTFVAVGVGGLAELLILWMGDQYAFVRIADGFCDTSSIMTEWRLPAAATSLVALRDELSGRSPTSYTAGEVVRVAARISTALRLAARVVTSLQVEPQRMRTALAESWALSADLAALICAARGWSWRTAHQIVGIAVRLAEEEGWRGGPPTSELLNRASRSFNGQAVGLDDAAIAEAFDPSAAVDARRMTGSPRPQEVARQLVTAGDRLSKDEDRLRVRSAGLTAAESKLARAHDALAAKASVTNT
jgi:argininosuccinate lyase